MQRRIFLTGATGCRKVTALPATRDGARPLGFVTIYDMLTSLVWDIENPDYGVMIVEVPRIRQLGRANVMA